MSSQEPEPCLVTGQPTTATPGSCRLTPSHTTRSPHAPSSPPSSPSEHPARSPTEPTGEKLICLELSRLTLQGAPLGLSGHFSGQALSHPLALTSYLDGATPLPAPCSFQTVSQPVIMYLLVSPLVYVSPLRNFKLLEGRIFPVLFTLRSWARALCLARSRSFGTFVLN